MSNTSSKNTDADRAATGCAKPTSLWRTPHYGLWFTADTSDVFADAVVTFAIPLVAYSLSQSEFISGSMATIAMATVMVLLPLGGVIADRFSRRRLMIAQGVGQGIIALLLAVCMVTHTLTVPLLAVAVLMFGVVSGLLGSATDAILRSLVPSELFARAQSVREGREAGVSLLSNPIGGALYGIFPWLPFAAGGALSVVGGAAAGFLPRKDADGEQAGEGEKAAESAQSKTVPERRSSFLADFIQGWHWAFTRRTLPWIVLSGMLMNVGFAGLETAVQLSLIAKGTNPVMIGMLFAGMGVCSFFGALIANRIVDRFRSSAIIMVTTLFTFVCFVPLVFSDDYWVAFVCLSLVGLLLPALNSCEFGFIYGRTPDELQGRVSSVVETSLGALGAVTPALAGLTLQFAPSGFRIVAIAASVLMACCMIIALVSPIRHIPITANWQEAEI